MSQRPEDVPPVYTWILRHRRFVLAILAAAAGFISLVIAWVEVSGTVIIADQLSWIAGAGFVGLFLLGIAAMAFWAEQRERELARLTEIERYLAAIAQALGLTETEGVAPTEEGGAEGKDRAIPPSPSRRA